jgi:hypothetical protein
MLHVFSTNRVKLVTRKPKTTNKLGQREYIQLKRQFDITLVSLVKRSRKTDSMFSNGMFGEKLKNNFVKLKENFIPSML